MQVLPAKYEGAFRRSIVLIAFYTLAVSLSMKSQIVVDPDIWWHLRVGQWILDHGWVPATDPFSSYGQGKPWVAYSWLFEVMAYGLYRSFGLVGIVIYTIVLSLGITAALYSLVRKFEHRVANAIAITGIGILAMTPIFMPRPWLFTILFFIIELDLLLAARRSGNYRRLLLLPPLFALWANLHVQFIYGLLPLGLVAAEPLIEQLFRRPFSFKNLKTGFNARQWLIVAACVMATLANPYHLKLYAPVIEIMSQTGAYNYVSELLAPDFRNITHWTLLALTIWAAFTLGRQLEVKPFPILLFIAGAFVSFRSSRDVWFVVTAAIAIIASSRPALEVKDHSALTKAQALVIATTIGILTIFVAQARNISEGALQNAVAGKYPVTAVNVVNERGYSGPLYNHFDWGGYLIWRLPRLPVSMDGRTNIYGDERVSHSIETWNGARHWANDPELAAARLVIADASIPLCSLLRLDQRFELVYEDQVAAVFIARSQMPVPEH
jgi:hypothetical protein